MTDYQSKIFFSGHYVVVAEKIKNLINEQSEWLSEQTIKSARAVGDSIESIIAEHFDFIIEPEYCKSYSNDFARRAMADLAFEDHEEKFYVVDVKTHRLSTKFNMPNLTSVERLSRFYESDKNYFVLLMIAYDTDGTKITVNDVTFAPVEYLDWGCLTVGALGWGQIQIVNSNRIILNQGYNRAKWMLELCDVMLSFYPKEIAKIDTRIMHFEKIKQFWKAKV